MTKSHLMWLKGKITEALDSSLIQEGDARSRLADLLNNHDFIGDFKFDKSQHEIKSIMDGLTKLKDRIFFLGEKVTRNSNYYPDDCDYAVHGCREIKNKTAVKYFRFLLRLRDIIDFEIDD